MKAINKILLAGLSFAVLTSGCLADLDLKPTDSVDQTVAIKSVSDLNTGVIGVYASFTAGNTQYATSLETDEALMPKENNTGRGVIPYRWQYDPSSAEPGAAWTNYYAVIDRVNRILKIVDNIPATGADADTKKRLKGELLAIRAYCHLELLSYYAVDYDAASLGVPIMLESKISKPKRDQVSKVLDQINADLTAAKDMIPASYAPAARSRVSKLTISAIQARTALLQKNYDAAVTFATEVITARNLATRTQFPNIWLDNDSDLSEVIWKLKRDNGDERMGDAYRDRTGRIIWAPAFKLMDSFDQVNDVRFASYFKNVGSTSAPRWTQIKFVGGQSALVNLADAKLFRVAEMYLIRAEAYAKKATPDITSGAADLNALRTARITGYAPQTFATAQDLITAVLQEKFKELAFESHRYVDLRRNNLPVNRGPKDVDQAMGAVNLDPSQKEYYFPIPSGETLANEIIEQHPKWK